MSARKAFIAKIDKVAKAGREKNLQKLICSQPIFNFKK